MEKTKLNRAKLFKSFDALKGLNEALREKEKIIVKKVEMLEDKAEKISNTLNILKKGDIAEITYFNFDNYYKITGIISQIDKTFKYLIIVKTKINFDDILSIKKLE